MKAVSDRSSSNNNSNSNTNDIAYEIMTSSNYFAMPSDKQQMLLTRFLALINNATLHSELKIVLMKDYIQGMPIVRIFLISKYDLKPILESTEFKYKVSNFNLPIRVKEYPKYLKMDDAYVRVLTLLQLPSSLQVGYAYSLLMNTNTNMVIIKLSRLEYSDALNKIMRLEGLLKASGRIKLQDKAVKAQALRDALLRQETALFKLTLNAVIASNDKKELVEKTKEFKRYNNAMLVKYDCIPFMQKELLLNHSYKELYIELGSLAFLYPFISSDMLELDGIRLGMNLMTKAPVIYDYRLRDNYNMVILATSGAGKSVTAKMITNRLITRYPDTYLYVIDPQGEYEPISYLYNADIIRLTEDKELGLDPFMLFDKRTACNVIADILNAPETVKKEILAIGADPAITIKTIQDLYDQSTDVTTKKYLIDLVKDRRFKGNMQLDRRTILSMKGTYGGSRTMEAFLITLALAKVWNTITSLPVSTPKILLIDEGWLLFNIETSAKFINLLARVGRKFNVIMMFITQRPEDVIENEYGRALLDNADTKILLRNDYTASMKIAQTLQLSKEEQELLPLFMKGECLFLTKEYRLRMQMMPTAEELRLFTTNPYQ